MSKRAISVKDSQGVFSARAAAEERDRLLERLEIAQAAAGLGIHDYDVINDRIEWDARVRALWGVSADEPINYAIFASGVHPDDLSAVESAVSAAIDPGGDGRYLARYRVISRSGSLYHVEATGRTSFQGGKAVRLVGTVRDITDEVTAAKELEDAKNFAENLVRSAPTLLYIFDLIEQRNVFIGPQIGGMAKMSPSDYADMGGELLNAVIHPDDLDRVLEHHRAIREGRIEPPFSIEYRLRRGDGSWLWLSSTEVVHARDQEGRPSQILGASLDITDRHEADALRELLIGEMGHRIRNMLSVVQSIATMTLRKGCEPEVWLAFERRMRALAAAHGLLTDGDWQSADFKDVACAVLQPFDDRDGRRIRLEGPPLPIQGTQVVTLALALHELATNAVKHGALSVPDGWVELTWRTDSGDRTLEWREKGGPPPKPMTKPGFGSAMIESLDQRAGEETFVFESGGLVCRLQI